MPLAFLGPSGNNIYNLLYIRFQSFIINQKLNMVDRTSAALGADREDTFMDTIKFQDELRELNEDLGTSSDGDINESDSSVTTPAARQALNSRAVYFAQGHSNNFGKKRDAKGSQKAKFNIEKLIIEHEKKKIVINELNLKREELEQQFADLQDKIGSRPNQGAADGGDFLQPQVLPGQQPNQKYHWDFLIKEMKWMAEDFERETKKKVADAKKNARSCRKQLQEKRLKKEKEAKDMKHEVRRKAVNMSRMVQQYWKSIEKVVKHNYNVLYEKKRQAQRTKRLESFVSKHLKLSVKVAEELNTKSFIQQSMYKPTDEEQAQESGAVLPENGVTKIIQEGALVEDPYKRQKNKESKPHEVPQGEEIPSSSQPHITRALIAEQTVEMAKSFQPTGTTLQTVEVKTKVPFLLQGSLREYQIIGLDWLVTLHNKRLNGILADEMGLGKTIQTISMLASLACDKGVWGPHLIVVPTTIIINWEMEFKKWCPALKILTYFGSQKERKIKRHGWSKENSFHVCITSYKLVIQDHFAFRRKKWYYMILDEAQNIKNFKSQRWQTLLRFNTKRRLLLTGTPLQNDVMELWSLMHFLMPQIFSSQQDFKEWFSNPFNQSITQNQSLNISVVQKLQSILRPFLLRRMKREVEKQLPDKVEHIVQCNLSRRQRLLYDEYINSDKTKSTLYDSSDFFSIMNVLMQLRKVCNHPDLFEARTIESPFIMQERVQMPYPSLMYKDLLIYHPMSEVNLQNLNFILSDFESMSRTEYQSIQDLYPENSLIKTIASHKVQLGNLQDALTTVRPEADGLALGKRLPINCNFFAKENTEPIKATTLAQVMPFYDANLKYLEDEIPIYLNTACLPYLQQYYSIDRFDRFRSGAGSRTYCDYETYLSALKNEEEQRFLIRFAQKLIQWRHYDCTNRMNLYIRKPVFGEDCRRAVKVNLVLQDIFDPKRNKNLDRYTGYSPKHNSELYCAPQAVLNPFALTLQQEISPDQRVSNNNIISDWQDQTDAEIEELYNDQAGGALVREMPLSLQLSNKKRKQLLKQQRIQEQIRRQQALEEEERLRKIEEERKRQEQAAKAGAEAIQQYIGESFTLVIDMAKLKAPVEDREMGVDTDWVNPCIEVKIDKVYKYNQEEIKATAEPIVNQEDGDYVIQEAKQDEGEMLVDSNLEGQQTREPNSGNLNENSPKKVGNLVEEKKSDDASPSKDAPLEPQQQNLEVKQPKEGGVQSKPPPTKQERVSYQAITYRNCEVLRDMIVTPLQRVSILEEEIRHYKFIIPKVVSRPVEFTPSKIITKHEKEKAYERFAYQKLMSHRNVHQSLRHSNILFFPHKNLIQYDCGKLQRLATLLKNLHQKGHKVLIFTQMTRILDILENFLNLHGYTYVRLDGSVKTEMRQRLVDKFNLNKKIFCFISSTRCGGIGINLTGADCVIFYDTDWNPAMDKQAQDRCHRIGQTKTVHIYWFISVNTIEENIFKKSLQKRDFGGMIIEGNFDMEIFMKRGITLKDILEDESIFRPKKRDLIKEDNIMFHTSSRDDNLIITKQQIEAAENPSMIDFERQKELEQYRKRFEEALVRIEDKEDVMAFQQARREIDDEFVEEVAVPQPQTLGGASTTQGDEGTTVAGENLEEPAQDLDQTDEAAKPTAVTSAYAQQLDTKNAQSLQRDLVAKKSYFIDWRNHPTLNDVTKSSIQYYEANYDFDAYLRDRAEKDNKFVNPDQDDGGEEIDNQETKRKNSEDDEGSQFSGMLSQGEESGGEETAMRWDRLTAEELYRQTKEDIERRFFMEPAPYGDQGEEEAGDDADMLAE